MSKPFLSPYGSVKLFLFSATATILFFRFYLLAQIPSNPGSDNNNLLAEHTGNNVDRSTNFPGLLSCPDTMGIEGEGRSFL
jgi:hypothetical protein